MIGGGNGGEKDAININRMEFWVVSSGVGDNVFSSININRMEFWALKRW